MEVEFKFFVASQKLAINMRNLVPSPTPNFLLSLAVRYCKRQKAGHGAGNEAKICVYQKFLQEHSVTNGCFIISEYDPLIKDNTLMYCS